jgi:uncharacterized phage protein gp47/JayE
MALQTPTVAEIDANIIAQMEASLNQTIPLLPKAFNRVLSKAMAAVIILLYKHASFIFLQLFIATATNEEVEVYGQVFKPLTAWGDLIGVTPQTAATRAEHTITITVLNQGGTLPTQTQLLADSNGVTYTTIGSVSLNAATVTATIRAVSDQGGGDGSGEIGNMQIGTEVNFVNPLGDVARTTTVASQTVTGADEEPVGTYRLRVQDAFKARPQGGAYSDYRIWGSAVEGVLNIYPYTGDPGQINVYVESSTETDGIPTDAQLNAVAQAIELDDDGLATRRPVSALVNTLPITRTGFDTVVVGVSGVTDISTLQNNIITAVGQYFQNREPYIPGLDVPPRRDRVQVSEVSGTVADLVSGAGGVFESVIVKETGTPIVVRSLVEGEKAKSDTVTFT